MNDFQSDSNSSSENTLMWIHLKTPFNEMKTNQLWSESSLTQICMEKENISHRWMPILAYHSSHPQIKNPSFVKKKKRGQSLREKKREKKVFLFLDELNWNGFLLNKSNKEFYSWIVVEVFCWQFSSSVDDCGWLSIVFRVKYSVSSKIKFYIWKM